MPKRAGGNCKQRNFYSLICLVINGIVIAHIINFTVKITPKSGPKIFLVQFSVCSNFYSMA